MSTWVGLARRCHCLVCADMVNELVVQIDLQERHHE